MKLVLTLMLSISAFYNGTAQKVKVVTKSAVIKPAVAKGIFKNLIDSFSYAAGYNVANNMKAQKISRINPVIMQKAIDDVYKGKQPLLTTEQMNACMQRQINDFSKAATDAEISRGVAFLETNSKRTGVITLPSGLQYEIIKSAPDSAVIKPKPIDTVVVNYVGTLIDGHEFESSYKRGLPAKFQVSGVIRGWMEILQLMRVGDKWRIFVPTVLAYYLNPRDPNQIPPGAALIFEISLEDIIPVVTQ